MNQKSTTYTNVRARGERSPLDSSMENRGFVRTAFEDKANLDEIINDAMIADGDKVYTR
jgi:hypothetical protein